MIHEILWETLCCSLLSRGTHAGDPRVHEESSSAQRSNNANFMT